MGLFDLTAPVFGAVDDILLSFLPAFLRLLLWGILAGWLTMLVYRKISNQEKIGVLKAEQKKLQRSITQFDGEFEHLLPVIWRTLGLGFRQLGLAIGPALLSTLPVLFLIIWAAGRFAYATQEAGDSIDFHAEPSPANLQWSPEDIASPIAKGWTVIWPDTGNLAVLKSDEISLLELPLDANVPLIHKKRWWNVLMANPLGYLPHNLETDTITFDLPEIQILNFGPGWVRGWMFSFFLSFLFSSIAFKFILKIE